jgi:hypothetical protein
MIKKLQKNIFELRILAKAARETEVELLNDVLAEKNYRTLNGDPVNPWNTYEMSSKDYDALFQEVHRRRLALGYQLASWEVPITLDVSTRLLEAQEALLDYLYDNYWREKIGVREYLTRFYSEYDALLREAMAFREEENDDQSKNQIQRSDFSNRDR